MSLDLGTLVAHAKLEDRELQQGLTGAKAQVAGLKQDLRSIGVTKARIDADSAQATARVKELKAELAGLDKEVQLGVATERTSARIEQVKAEIASISDARVQIDVDSAKATAQMKAVQAEVAHLDGQKATIEVGVDRDHLNLANKGVSTLMSSILAIAPAAVPVLAATAGATGALGAGLLAAGGAGGVFAASVVGVVTQMKAGQDAIGQLSDKLATQKKGSAEYAATLAQLRGAQRSFTAEFGPAAAGLDQVKSAWSGFMSATKGQTVQVIGAALSAAAGVLRQVAPLANAAGGAVQSLVQDFATWSQGSGMKSLLTFFQSQGPGYITSFGHIAGNVLLGVVNLFRAFSPLTTSVVGGLDSMTGAFARWSAGLSGNSAFQSFLAYVQASMPAVAALVGNLVGVFAHLIAGLAPLGGPVLAALNGIAGAIRSIPVPVITAAAVAIATFGAAVTVVNIATKLFASAQLVAAGATKVWAAGQWLLNAALTANPIGLVVVAVAALVAGLIIAYKHSETFRHVVQAAFQAIRSVVASVVGWIGHYVPQVFGAVAGAVRAVLSGMRAAVGAAWRAIVSVVRGAVNSYRAVVSAAFRTALGLVRSAVNATRSVVSSVWRAIASVVRSSVSAARSAISSGFSAARAAVASAMSAARAAVSGAMHAIRSAVVSGIGGVVGVFHSLGGRIRGALGGLAGTLRSVGVNMIRGLIGGISSMAGAVAARARSVVSSAVHAAKAALGIASPSKVFHKIGVQTIQGYVKGIGQSRSQVDAALEKVFDGIRKYEKQHKRSAHTSRVVIKALADETRALQKNASARDAVNQRLADARQMRSDITSAAVDYGSISSISSTGSDGEDTPVTTASIAAGLKERLAAIRRFAGELAKLRKNGLNEAAIRDIASKGVEDGGVYAAALSTATKAQIRGINATQSAIGKAASSVGGQAVAGLVKGLTDQLHDIDVAGVRIARRLRAAIRRELRIHSPSRRLAEDGRNTALGLAQGVLDGTSAAERAAMQMASRVRAAGAVQLEVAPARIGLQATAGSRAALSPARSPQGAGTSTGQADAINRLVRLLERQGFGVRALAAGDLVVRETVDFDRYEQQRAFRERAASV